MMSALLEGDFITTITLMHAGWEKTGNRCANKTRNFIYNRPGEKTNQKQKTDAFRKKEAGLPTRGKTRELT